MQLSRAHAKTRRYVCRSIRKVNVPNERFLDC